MSFHACRVWLPTLPTLRRSCQRSSNFIASLDVQHGKAIPVLHGRSTVVPMATVSILFFMWGTLYGLLDIMNFHVKKAMGLKSELAAIMALSYYGAYIPGTILIGSRLVTKSGYRVAMFVGLLFLALGSLVMSFGAMKMSLAGMVGGQFVIGLGVSTLERSANPYATNCGPRIQAALRILVGQTWAGIGTVIAPFLANAFVFTEGSGSDIFPAADPSHAGKCLFPEDASGDLTSVVTFYRYLAAVIVGIAFAMWMIFFRTYLVPEVAQQHSPPTTCGWKKWQHPLVSMRYTRLWWGVFANFFNLGCQVAVAQFFVEHMTINACTTAKQGATYMSYAQTGFVAGRIMAAGLVAFPRIFKPRYVLLVFLIAAVAFTSVSTIATGSLAVIFGVMIMFFEAPSFPMIFESATAENGQWAPAAETITICSISGGGVLPLAMGFMNSAFGISRSWSLVACCFGIVSTYAIANNLIPSYRRALDRAEQEQGPHSPMIDRGIGNDDEERGGEKVDEEDVMDVTRSDSLQPIFGAAAPTTFGSKVDTKFDFEDVTLNNEFDIEHVSRASTKE